MPLLPCGNPPASGRSRGWAGRHQATTGTSPRIQPKPFALFTQRLQLWVVRCCPLGCHFGICSQHFWDPGCVIVLGRPCLACFEENPKTPTHLEVPAFGDNPTISEQVRWPQGSPQNANMTSMFGNVWDGVSLRDMPSLPNNSLLGGDGPFDAAC